MAPPSHTLDLARPEDDVAARFCTSCGSRSGDCLRPHQPPSSPSVGRFVDRRLAIAGLAILIAAALVAGAILWRGQVSLQARTAQLERAVDASRDELRDTGAELREAREATAAELDAVRDALPEVPDIAAVAEKVQPSVFMIETEASLGSSWVVASSGSRSRLITNFHVVADAWTNGRRDVSVLKEDGTFPGTIIEVDEASDLAVVEVPVALHPLERAAEQPEVGDGVLALGSPLGLEGTVSSGIVSAFRTEDGVDYLQFSAPISPGNSGGPVVDTKGRVVGVSVAKAVSEGAEGLSFAIPVNQVCVHLEVC